MLTILTLPLLILYGMFLIYILVRLLLHAPALPVPTSDKPSLSVVVPFKNEAHNLGALCASLASQEYSGPWEIVLVNDGSDDGFESVLDRFRDRFTGRLRCIPSRFDAAKRITSKQQALDTGVEAAVGEWIVLTDADMTFDRHWLSTGAANVATGFDLAFGHTAIRYPGRGIFEYCQRFQLEFLFAAAYAFRASSLDASCMGNNLIVRKKAYVEFGGQAGIGYSIVEDRDLYRKFARQGRTIGAIEPFSAKAFTTPCPHVPQFYQQMLRWMRGGFSGSPQLLGAALLFTIQNITFFASVSGLASRAVCIAAAFNFLVTMVYAGLSFGKIKSTESIFFVPVYLAFSVIEAAVFCLSFVLTPRVSWKKTRL